MANTKENKDKKKVNISSTSKDIAQKAEKSTADLSKKSSSNVGKGPAGENL